MTIMTNPNTEILEAMKESKVFCEFSEFGVGSFLMGYFDTPFSKKFLVINPLLLDNVDSILVNDLLLLDN